MASVNKAIIIGNLGRDPEVRYTASGEALCNITVATSETWKDKATGEKKEATEWHRISFFGKLAEIAGDKNRIKLIVYRRQQVFFRDKRRVHPQIGFSPDKAADRQQLDDTLARIAGAG